MLVVFITFTRTAVETLFCVEEIGRFVPNIAEVVDTKLISSTILCGQYVAFIGGLSQFDVCHASFVEHFLKGCLVGVAHLHHHTRILGEEHLDEVVTLKVVEVYLKSALRVGKAHLEQAGDETARTNVVTCQDEAFLHQLLNGVESIAEVFGILHRGHIATHLLQRLGKSRTAEA